MIILRRLPLKQLVGPPSITRYLHYVQGQSPEPKVREYFYYVDHQGMLFLDDAKMKNFTSCFKELHFLKFFFKRLKKNNLSRYDEDFPFVSMCGKERNFLRCDDVPIVFTDVIDDNLLSYNHGSRFLTVDFQPEKICMVPESGRIYHPGPEKAGGIGLLADKLGIEWTAEKRFVFANGEENPPTEFVWNNQNLLLTNELIGKLPKRSAVGTKPQEAGDNQGKANCVLHDFTAREFFMSFQDDGSKAYVKYEMLRGDQIHFQTTQVPVSQQGKGIARVLVEHALDFCVENNLKFTSSCWYINEYLSKNPSKKYRRLFRL